jgi:hypothetical protein
VAFHKSNLGSFGSNLPCDINGYVPEADDNPWGFVIDHGSEATHDDDGNLTEYGEWWEDEGFPEWRDGAIRATEEAEQSLSQWRQRNR